MAGNHAQDRNQAIVLAAAVIAMGLLAGLIYAFSVTVLPDLMAADEAATAAFASLVWALVLWAPPRGADVPR